MKSRFSTKKTAQAAIMTALLVILQFATRSLGQLVTGSCVNFVLTSTVLISGIGCALVVAVLSPVFAFLLGIGPAFAPLIPCICIGNIVLVLLLKLIIGTNVSESNKIRIITAVLSASAAKFLILFVSVTKIAVPALSLPESKAAVISASFSWPQLVTALIGTSIAVLVCPRILKGIRNRN